MTTIKKPTPLTPTKLSPQDYTQAVAKHLKTFEGAVPRIYTDAKGIPTMGTGIALAVSGDGKDYTLRDLTQIGAEISGDPAKPYLFSDAEKKLLADTVSKLNDPKIMPDARAEEAQKLIPPYKYGNETAADNKFGFTLSDERIAKQAEATWTEHRERAFKTVRDQATKRGWSKEQTDSYIDQFKGSNQEIAMTSLAFNGVPTPKATGAMLDGDLPKMRQEILYRSNTGGVNGRGWAKRRQDEADLATGRYEDWTPQQREQWRVIESTPAADRYRKTYPDTFPQYGPPMPPKDSKQSESSPQPTPSPASEQKQSKAPADPQVAAMVEMAAKPVDNPGRAALLKPVENLTQPEMTDMINHALGDYRGHRSGDPLKYHTYEKVQDWHAAMYGDGPQQYDGGKPIEPTPIAADILGHEHGKITYGHYGEPKPSSMHYRRPRSSISARSG